jgi:hypothetical protein
MIEASARVASAAILQSPMYVRPARLTLRRTLAMAGRESGSSAVLPATVAMVIGNPSGSSVASAIFSCGRSGR